MKDPEDREAVTKRKPISRWICSTADETGFRRWTNFGRDSEPRKAPSTRKETKRKDRLEVRNVIANEIDSTICNLIFPCFPLPCVRCLLWLMF